VEGSVAGYGEGDVPDGMQEAVRAAYSDAAQFMDD
jgi:hypothetical protein